MSASVIIFIGLISSILRNKNVSVTYNLNNLAIKDSQRAPFLAHLFIWSQVSVFFLITFPVLSRFLIDLILLLYCKTYDAILAATKSGKWIFCILQFGETNCPFSVTEKYSEGQYLLSMAHTHRSLIKNPRQISHCKQIQRLQCFCNCLSNVDSDSRKLLSYQSSSQLEVCWPHPKISWFLVCILCYIPLLSQSTRDEECNIKVRFSYLPL